MIGRKYLLPILLLLIFTSCKKEPIPDDNLWVGTTRVLDQNIPFPFLFEKTEDGLLLIDHKNTLIDSVLDHRSQYQAGDTIKMQDHQFLVMKALPNLLLFDLKDSLNFPYLHPLYAARFVPAENSEAVDLSSFKQKLRANSYSTEVKSAHFATPNRDLKVVKTMNFSEDLLQTFYTYYYQNELIYAEKEEAEFYIFGREGKVFLSTHQQDGNPQTLYQITKIEDESFEIRTFRDLEEQTERLEISEAPETSANYQLFERCMAGQPGEYYHDNLTYLKGNEYLIQKIGKNAPAASGDGYITVHFTINCKGEMGNPGLEQMDREFQSTSFDPALVQHIITEVMQLKDWPEIKSGYFYKDIHSFLMFKVKNGKITDVSP